MTVILDGSRSLWPDIHSYLQWIIDHEDEVLDRANEMDENARLIYDIISAYSETLGHNPQAMATLKIVTERYISDYHPHIAQIKGGYAKRTDD